MRESRMYQHTLPNGMVVLGQSMPWLKTAAFSLQVPAGSVREPSGQNGLAALTCECSERGCGELGNREFLEATELLGASTNNHVATYSIGYSGSCLHQNLIPLLRLYAALSQAATLAVEEFDPSQLVCLQELYSQEDDLPQQTLRTLRRRYFGEQLGRWPDGEISELETIQYPSVVDYYRRNYSPQGAILSVAGNLDWNECLDSIQQLWGQWKDQGLTPLQVTLGTGGYQHLEEESQQTHIALAGPVVPFGHPEYYRMRCAIGVLGDGMSSRLFQEVREKRGLCYSVFAGVHSLKDQACVSAYAGTTAPRAQETLDTILAEFETLKQGITEQELLRVKTQIRTGLMAQQESCRSRANAMAGDWFYLGRVRTPDEISAELEALTVERVNHYLETHPFPITSLVTVGPAELELPDGLC